MNIKIAIFIIVMSVFVSGCAVYQPYGGYGYGYAAPVVPMPMVGFGGWGHGGFRR